MSAGERELAALWQRLPAPARDTLLDFARYLAERHGAPAPVPAAHANPGESVVQAVRRLTRSHGRNRARALVADIERLMAAHMMDGRPAGDTIADLESAFARAAHDDQKD